MHYFNNAVPDPLASKASTVGQVLSARKLYNVSQMFKKW